MTMVKSFIKESTVTTGTGPLTLSQIVGFGRFLGTETFAADSLVKYAIQNGNNLETGIGTIRAGNILERTTPETTLVGGVYDATTPAAINLIGASTVYCDLNSPASATSDGFLLNTDWVIFNGKIGPSGGVITGNLEVDGLLGVGGNNTSVNLNQIQLVANASGFTSSEFTYTNTTTGYGNFDFYNITTAAYEFSFGVTPDNYFDANIAGCFYIDNYNGTPFVINRSTGNVGAGIAGGAPTAKLHIGANVSSAAGNAAMSFDASTVANLLATPVSGNVERVVSGMYFTPGSAIRKRWLTCGHLTKSVAGGANVTLSATDYENTTYRFTGALTANIKVIFPVAAFARLMTGVPIIVNNATTSTLGPWTLTVIGSSGTGIVVGQGFTATLYSDGTNILRATADV